MFYQPLNHNARYIAMFLCKHIVTVYMEVSLHKLLLLYCRCAGHLMNMLGLIAVLEHAYAR